MRRLAIAAAAVLLIPAGMSAQTAGGGISADMLKEISKGYAGTAADKALRNALNTTSITVLAENADNQGEDTWHNGPEVFREVLAFLRAQRLEGQDDRQVRPR